MTFTCTGEDKVCLNCPLNDCIRDACITDDGFIKVRVLQYPIPDHKAEYSRAYYEQNRDRIKERNRLRYHERKGRTA